MIYEISLIFLYRTNPNLLTNFKEIPLDLSAE